MAPQALAVLTALVTLVLQCGSQQSYLDTHPRVPQQINHGAYRVDKPFWGNELNREWFQDAKFGMFIHFGVYSMVGAGEWLLETHGLHLNQYLELAKAFNPVEFNAAGWVALAKEAGMKYITITAKHHDGFGMWPSKFSNWNTAGQTQFKRDIIMEVVSYAREQGIKVVLYYSLLDWGHPDYYPLGRTGHRAGRQQGGNFTKYVGYMKDQLAELLSRYGPIHGIWFDGWWDKPDAPWNLEDIYGHIHDLQPSTLVGNNHHQAPLLGEDFQMWEKDLPGAQATQHYNQGVPVGSLPLEMCDTMAEGNYWGYVNNSVSRPAADLVRMLIKAAGANSNLLLNVGPTGLGSIAPSFAHELVNIGKWMANFGTSIHNSRAGPMPPQPWGVSTQTKDGARVFIHIVDAGVSGWGTQPSGQPFQLLLPGVGYGRVSRALIAGSSLTELHNIQVIATNDGAAVAVLPPAPPFSLDSPPPATLLVLEMWTASARMLYQERFYQKDIAKVMATPQLTVREADSGKVIKPQH